MIADKFQMSSDSFQITSYKLQMTFDKLFAFLPHFLCAFLAVSAVNVFLATMNSTRMT